MVGRRTEPVEDAPHHPEVDPADNVAPLAGERDERASAQPNRLTDANGRLGLEPGLVEKLEQPFDRVALTVRGRQGSGESVAPALAGRLRRRDGIVREGELVDEGRRECLVSAVDSIGGSGRAVSERRSPATRGRRRLRPRQAALDKPIQVLTDGVRVQAERRRELANAHGPSRIPEEAEEIGSSSAREKAMAEGRVELGGGVHRGLHFARCRT